MKPRALLLCFALALPASLSAQINISSVSGIVSDNQTITIAGTGFGTKSPAAPILWADFSSGINPSNLGQRTSWSEIQNLVRTVNLPAGAGTNCGVVGTWDTSTGDPHYVSSFSFCITKTYWTKVYVFAKRYYDFEATTNQKFFRINPNPAIGMNDFVAVYHKGWWTAFLSECDSDNPDRFREDDVGMNCFTKDRWMNEEFIWQYEGGSGLNANGRPGLGSGIIDYTRDGVVLQHQENIYNGVNTHSDLRMLDNFTPSNIPTDTPPNGSHVYMADLYADETYSRVMLGNAATLAASTHREILIPTSWSNTSISAVVNMGTFPAGSTAYLYVIDSSNTPNSSGFPVTVAHDETYTAFANWVAANFTAAEQANDAISGPLADPDAAGVTNLQRYAFALPARGPVASPVTLGIATADGASYLTLTCPRRAAASDLSYTLESSTDLITWATVEGHTSTAGPNSITAQDAVALGSAPCRFLRVRITASP